MEPVSTSKSIVFPLPLPNNSLIWVDGQRKVIVLGQDTVLTTGRQKKWVGFEHTAPINPTQSVSRGLEIESENYKKYINVSFSSLLPPPPPFNLLLILSLTVGVGLKCVTRCHRMVAYTTQPIANAQNQFDNASSRLTARIQQQHHQSAPLLSPKQKPKPKLTAPSKSSLRCQP